MTLFRSSRCRRRTWCWACIIFRKAKNQPIPKRYKAKARPFILDRKSTRLNSSHTVIYTLSLHDALPIFTLPSQDMVLGLYYISKGKKSTDTEKVQGEGKAFYSRSEEHTSELQSHSDLHSFPT